MSRSTHTQPHPPHSSPRIHSFRNNTDKKKASGDGSGAGAESDAAKKKQQQQQRQERHARARSQLCKACTRVLDVNIKRGSCVPANGAGFEVLQVGSLQDRCLYLADTVGKR